MLRPGAPSRLTAALLMTLESQLEESEGETAETQVLCVDRLQTTLTLQDKRVRPGAQGARAL